MGNCSCKNSSAWPLGRGAPIREVTLVLLGLDNAGKTTLLANLNKEPTDDTTPTIGFSSTTLDIGRFALTVYDLGGGARIRDIWTNYYAESHGFVFVVDASSEEERMAEAREALRGVLQDNKMAGKPLLILANKQDKEGALGEREIWSRLELDQLLQSEGSGEETHSSVVKCIALKSASGHKSDPAIRRGVHWLLQRVEEQWEEITGRVRVDVEAQRALEAQRKRERSERVRRIREERERLAALERAQNGGQEEEEDAGNPFKPIEQAAKEAEERERAAKEMARWAQSPPPRVVTVAEATSSEPTYARDQNQRRGERASPSHDPPSMSHAESGRDKGLETVPRPAGSQSTLAISDSQPASGLSESSDSLTDVTPSSHDHASSSDSLHLAAAAASGPPLDPLPSTSPSQPAGKANGIIMPEKKGKKPQRKMFLSRLKNRNKTAPAPDPLTQPPPTTTLTLHPTTTSPGLQRPSITRDMWVTPSPSPAVTHDPLEGLPELPRIRHVLPPIKVSKQPPGLGEKAFHVAEDITVPPSAIIVSQPPPSPSVDSVSA